jgi:hypothetical protein
MEVKQQYQINIWNRLAFSESAADNTESGEIGTHSVWESVNDNMRISVEQISRCHKISRNKLSFNKECFR